MGLEIPNVRYISENLFSKDYFSTQSFPLILVVFSLNLLRNKRKILIFSLKYWKNCLVFSFFSIFFVSFYVTFSFHYLFSVCSVTKFFVICFAGFQFIFWTKIVQQVHLDIRCGDFSSCLCIHNWHMNDAIEQMNESKYETKYEEKDFYDIFSCHIALQRSNDRSGYDYIRAVSFGWLVYWLIGFRKSSGWNICIQYTYLNLLVFRIFWNWALSIH